MAAARDANRVSSFIMTKTLLDPGSSGLIDSEVYVYFASPGYTIHGVDNDRYLACRGAPNHSPAKPDRLPSTAPCSTPAIAAKKLIRHDNLH